MRTLPRVNVDNLGGLFDKVTGLGKEIVGEFYDEKRLIDAGTAQQAKGTEKLEALRKQTKAKEHRRQARTYADKEKQAASSSA